MDARAVNAHICHRRAALIESGVAYLTLEGALSGEQSPAMNEAVTLTEFSIALFALEWLFAGMCSYVLPDGKRLDEISRNANRNFRFRT